MSVLVVGEALVDVVTTADGSSSEHPGGSPLNVAVGLGRLDLAVQFLTTFGDDPHGELVARHLEASRVTVLRSPARHTSVARAQLDDEGRASYEFDLAWALDTIPEIAAPDWLHVGSLGVTEAPGAALVADLVTQHAGTAVVSYDPNCRPLVMGAPAAALAAIEEQVRRSDVVKLSDEDAAWLFPATPHEEVAQRWLELGPALVVITLGAEGARAWTPEHSTSVPAPAGEPVVDTVGAGDAFMGGLIWSLSSCDPRALDADQLAEALTQAAVVARRTCERAGADPPWLREL